MSPWLTDFLNRIQPSEDFVACVQDSGGKIFTVVGEIQEIYWLEMNSEGKGHRGINVAVRPLKKNYRYGVAGWQIWGNHVLAIARLRVPAKPTSTPDPDGEKFTNFVKKYGTRK